MGRLVVFEDAAAFRARVEPFLLEHEAENNLLFGIASAIEGGRYDDPLLSVLERDGGIELVAIRTPPHNLVLSWGSESATRALADELDMDLPGVNARAEQAAAFAEAWTARTGCSHHRRMAQRIYALTEVEPPSRVPGEARAATRADRDLVVGWMLAFEREVLDADDANAGQAGARFDWLLADEHSGLLLWEDGGVPVSLTGRHGPTPNGLRIGPVYTPPEHRARGYASACVAEASARVLASGRRFCFLYADLANPTSNSVYQRIGYRPVCDAADYRFTRAARAR